MTPMVTGEMPTVRDLATLTQWRVENISKWTKWYSGISLIISLVTMSYKDSHSSSGFCSAFHLDSQRQSELAADQERKPFTRSFCCDEDSRLDRSLFVILIEYSVILIPLILSTTFILSKTEQIWFLCTRLTVNLSGSHFTWLKTMNNRTSTESHCVVLVVRPAGSRKTRLLVEWLSIRRTSCHLTSTTSYIFINTTSHSIGLLWTESKIDMLRFTLFTV